MRPGVDGCRVALGPGLTQGKGGMRLWIASRDVEGFR